jgi:hypothetical protein
VGVLCDQQQGAVGCCVGQQVENGQRDPKVLRRLVITYAQGRVEHSLVRRSESRRVRAHWSQ